MTPTAAQDSRHSPAGTAAWRVSTAVRVFTLALATGSVAACRRR